MVRENHGGIFFFKASTKTHKMLFIKRFDSTLNAPYYLLRGSRLYGSSLSNAGSNGYYWSSTPSGSSYAYNLYFYSGYVSTNGYARYYSQSVRCVAAG